MVTNRRRPRVRRSRGVALFALIAIAQACVPTPQSKLSAASSTGVATTLSPRVISAQPPVLLYGDSIGSEISPYLKSRLSLAPRVKLVSRVYGGTNACDWLGLAKADNTTYKPKYVVIIFTGNRFTPCTRVIGDQPTLTQAIDMTVSGVRNLMSNFPTAHFFLVGFPRSVAAQEKRDAGLITGTDLLNWKLSKLAQTSRSTYVSTPNVMYDSDGRAQRTLPCTKELDGFFCGTSGIVTVRAPDGGHLCPVSSDAVLGVIPKCQVPSPGANRITKMIHTAITTHIASNR